MSPAYSTNIHTDTDLILAGPQKYNRHVCGRALHVGLRYIHVLMSTKNMSHTSAALHILALNTLNQCRVKIQYSPFQAVSILSSLCGRGLPCRTSYSFSLHSFNSCFTRETSRENSTAVFSSDPRTINTFFPFNSPWGSCRGGYHCIKYSRDRLSSEHTITFS